MTLGELTSRWAVLHATEEFDRLGRERFLEKHGFGAAREYFLVVDGRHYDSKAIAAVAHGYQFPDRGPLRATDFSGGEQTVKRKLEELGFEIVRVTAGGRNPAWERDELILALDLYLGAGLLDDSDKRVVALSELLNGLPLHPLRADAARFRNPNGVALKLANFAAIDPSYPGRGMSRGGRGDRQVWDELAGQPDLVSELAAGIREEAQSQEREPLPPEEDEAEALEGRLLFRRHRVRERDRRLTAKKKAQALSSTGRLHCEVCGFEFGDTYGDQGRGFIECHHIQPLGAARGLVRTRLSDLALVCSNCHRMLHRGSPAPSIGTLREALVVAKS